MFGKLKRYLKKVAVAEDQALNVVLTDGRPDETLSTHSQIAADRGNWLGRAVTKALHVFQRDHGNKAKSGDRRRAEAEINRIDSDGG